MDSLFKPRVPVGLKTNIVAEELQNLKFLFSEIKLHFQLTMMAQIWQLGYIRWKQLKHLNDW